MSYSDVGKDAKRAGKLRPRDVKRLAPSEPSKLRSLPPHRQKKEYFLRTTTTKTYTSKTERLFPSRKARTDCIRDEKKRAHNRRKSWMGQQVELRVDHETVDPD